MRHLNRRQLRLVLTPFALLLSGRGATAQEKSVNPGINDSYRDPDPAEFVKQFEVESREIFANREKIAETAGARPGMVVADIGAGTGLFTRLFAKSVGRDGKVYAVDIAKPFLELVERTSKEAGVANVQTVLASAESSNLPDNSVDLAFVCDTYHHFEFPQKTMASIHRALRAGGRVIVIDFHRVQGVSSDWVMEHVRAGQDVFRKEIESAGFRLVEEPKFLKENYYMIFQKAADRSGESASTTRKSAAK